MSSAVMDTLRPGRATVTPERPPLREPEVSSISTRALLLEAPGRSSSAYKRIWAVAHEVESWADVEEAVARRHQPFGSRSATRRAISRRRGPR